MPDTCLTDDDDDRHTALLNNRHFYISCRCTEIKLQHLFWTNEDSYASKFGMKLRKINYTIKTNSKQDKMTIIIRCLCTLTNLKCGIFITGWHFFPGDRRNEVTETTSWLLLLITLDFGSVNNSLLL